MERYGVKGKILQWIKGFLSSRTFNVRVGGSTSSAKPVISGIPQGSVLGPILFVIFINDLPDAVEYSEAYLFADDLKILQCIYQHTDCDKLQQDIYKVQEWTETNHLKFHPDKCSYMRIGKSKLPKATYSLNTDETQPTLRETFKENDIGVIDNSLSFEDHINEKIKKSNKVLRVIRRTFITLDKNTFPLLYKSLVRPHLEYANQCWAPHLMRHIEAIENVQRRATKLVQGLRDLPYED